MEGELQKTIPIRKCEDKVALEHDILRILQQSFRITIARK
jgi:hypothetical protein